MTDSELKKFISLVQESRDSFEPLFQANSKTVDIRLMMALRGGIDGFLGSLNRIARQRRQLQYKFKVNSRLFSGQKIVSEGDSWFQFPILLADVIDQLFNPFEAFDRYAVFSLGAAGDLLKDIVKDDEISQAIEAEQPEVFLISGGGNDLVADGNLANFLKEFDRNNTQPAAEYINEEFEIFLREIIQLYRGLFIRLLSRFPDLRIICHGYDYAIPNNGISLGKPMKSRGIEDPGLQREIMRIIIDRLNKAQIDLIQDVEFAGLVHHVDCRGVVGENWFDELHPNNKGFEAVGKLFDNKIKELTKNKRV